VAVATFPRQYSSIPTAIPALAWPAWPAAPKLTPIPTPLPILLVPRLAITPTFPVVLTNTVQLITPAPLNISLIQTPSPTDPTPTPWALIDDVLSTTAWLSASMISDSTEVFTVATAPADYVPGAPRPIANVGYTFEQMSNGAGSISYSINSWAALIGYAASIPVQLVKTFKQLSTLLGGPLSLFAGWLLIFLPLAIFVESFDFFKRLIISITNLVIKLVRFVGDLWDMLPGL
jgi:hypothetical protein